MFDLIEKIPSKYKDYNIIKIKSDASKRKYYRLLKNDISFIYMDSIEEKQEYYKFLKVYSYLSKVNISIPKIYDRIDKYNILILEDFGNLRFDKILQNYSLQDLLYSAVNTLIILKNEINFNKKKDLNIYNFKTFKFEISEFIDFFYPYTFSSNLSTNLKTEFYSCWKNIYDSINFEFNTFVHKDFNINNLVYLKERKDHLRCGVLDFQDAFWGENCWDLFSLLEDSRILFDEQFNEYFIEYYYKNSNQNISINDFKKKYYMLNCARQTRLLGRWIKLYQTFNKEIYLKFIPITKKRLFNGLTKLNNQKLKLLYDNFFSELK